MVLSLYTPRADESDPQGHVDDDDLLNSAQRRIGVTAEMVAEARAANTRERQAVMDAVPGLVILQDGTLYVPPTPVDLQRANLREAVKQGINIGCFISQILHPTAVRQG